MGILFGILILILITVALLNRRREKTSWLREERYDESGAWVDKRASERGTFGALDAEREAERFALTQQGRINDLALEMRSYAFEHIPGFHERGTAVIKSFTDHARTQAARLLATIEAIKIEKIPEIPQEQAPNSPHIQALKKQMLHFAYEQFPWLLDLDLETIQQLDHYVATIAQDLLGKDA